MSDLCPKCGAYWECDCEYVTALSGSATVKVSDFSGGQVKRLRGTETRFNPERYILPGSHIVTPNPYPDNMGNY